MLKMCYVNMLIVFAGKICHYTDSSIVIQSDGVGDVSQQADSTNVIRTIKGQCNDVSTSDNNDSFVFKENGQEEVLNISENGKEIKNKVEVKEEEKHVLAAEQFMREQEEQRKKKEAAELFEKEQEEERNKKEAAEYLAKQQEEEQKKKEAAELLEKQQEEE